MKKSIWSFKLSTAALALIPAGVGINFVGKLLVSVLKAPLWLDSIGTILSAMLAGPIVGAIVGLLNNVVVALTALDSMALVYALTQIGIGLVAGILAKTGFIKNIVRATLTGLIVGLTAVVISTPLNIIFWGGQTGNLWGDAVFLAMEAADYPMWLSSLADEIVIDLPDKVIVTVIAYLIFVNLPKTLTSMYDSQSVEAFDESDA